MKFVCYTRKPVSEAEYAPRLGLSMHLGVENGGVFEPLNHNYGVLFAKATQDPESLALCPKSLKRPFVLPVEGGFVVIAIRTEANGEPDESSRGCAIVFQSPDLVHYTELGLLKLADDFLDDVSLKICDGCGGFVAKYAVGGRVYRRKLIALTLPSDDVKECGNIGREDIAVNIEGAVGATEFEVESQKADYALKKLTPVHAVSVEFDKTCKKERLGGYRVKVNYSDGSAHYKRVDWEEPKNGIAKGKIHIEHYDFPIAENRADPCVYRYNGEFYFVATNDADGNRSIFVRRAKTIPELVNAPEKLILDAVTYPHVGGLLWAPEFHNVAGKEYIFHACTPKEFGDEQSHVMVLKDGGELDDKNSWEAPKRVLKKDGSPLYDKGITLDMTTFEDGGRQYVAWSQRQFNPIDLGAWVYIAEIDKNEPWRLISDPVLLTLPEYGWQNNHTLVDEGPFALIRGGKVFLTFSSALVDTTYCVGLLSADCGADLLDPKSWTKGNYPILHSLSKAGEFGPGHNAYVTDEFGDTWNTYHARPSLDGPRSSGIRRVHFGFDGEPVLDLIEERDLPEEMREIEVKVE